jgi:release factor glutamine methyltransferase
VVASAGDWLAPGGSLLFEVGEAQVPAATGIVAAAGLLPRVAADEETGATVVIGTAAGT